MHEGARMLGMETEKTGLEPKTRPLRVPQDCVGRGQSLGPLIATEGRQGLDAEQRLQAVDRGTGIEVLRIDPRSRRAPRQRDQPRPVGFRGDQLRRPESRQLITQRFVARLDPQQCQLAGRAVEGGNPVIVRPQADRHRIVGATRKVRILDHGSWRQYTDDLASHQAMSGGGILDLVAECDPQACLEQPTDIALECVVGDAGHRDAMALPQLAGRQRDAQQRRGPLGILPECFVEVAETEEHDGIRIVLLDSLVLVEDWNRLQGVA